jgi:hypothetical protein
MGRSPREFARVGGAFLSALASIAVGALGRRRWFLTKTVVPTRATAMIERFVAISSDLENLVFVFCMMPMKLELGSAKNKSLPLLEVAIYCSMWL